MKKSLTTLKVSCTKILSESPNRRVAHPDSSKITPYELKPEETLIYRLTNQHQSSRASQKTQVLKPTSSSLPQTARISPVPSTASVLKITLKLNSFESKKACPRALKSLIKAKNLLIEDLKPSKFKPSTSEIVTKASREIYDFPEKLLSGKEVKTRREAIHKAHLCQTFNGLKAVENMKKLDLKDLPIKLVNLPEIPGNRKTVVFDLDETLVHCVDGKKGDVSVTVKFPNGESHAVGINIRPYARECLSEASKDFEVILFTASHKAYADAVLDHLDPKGELIQHRLYRENCVTINGMHVKNLDVFKNRKIENIVIVDNTVHSFALHIDNGIPIISWHNDRYDRELFKLIDYLKLLASSADIRETNRQTFKLSRFYQELSLNNLIN